MMNISLPHSRFPATYLSLNKPWGPSGGHRQSRDHCNEPLRPPLPRSPQVGEEEGERAPRTHRCPRGEAEEAGQGCLLLDEDRKRICLLPWSDLLLQNVCACFISTFNTFSKRLWSLSFSCWARSQSNMATTSLANTNVSALKDSGNILHKGPLFKLHALLVINLVQCQIKFQCWQTWSIVDQQKSLLTSYTENL